MILDVVFVLIILAAFYNGYSKGIIYSVLSLIAIVLGVIIAMNFSSAASVWLNTQFNIPAVIMPTLSFVLVLIAVVLAVRLVAYLAEKFLKTIMLNVVNKLAGGILWAVIASMLFSLLVFLISKTGIFTESLISSSYSYKYIVPFGPFTLKTMQALIPYLQESFEMMNNTVKEFAN
ncbi:MAG: CvpA family protein [Chitinophagales bacterium]|nr:CvpA family protein [Bacteroidota bacterium]MCB9225961.1 CvpA family protein [Chitinophagales bacterium]